MAMTQPHHCSVPGGEKQQEGGFGGSSTNLSSLEAAVESDPVKGVSVTMSNSQAAPKTAPGISADISVGKSDSSGQADTAEMNSDDAMETKMPPPPRATETCCRSEGAVVDSSWNRSISQEPTKLCGTRKCRGSLPFKKRRLHPLHLNPQWTPSSAPSERGIFRESGEDNGDMITLSTCRSAPSPLSSCPATPTNASRGMDWSGGTVSAPTSHRPDWPGRSGSFTNDTDEKRDVSSCRENGNSELEGSIVRTDTLRTESDPKESVSQSEDCLGGATCRIAALALVASQVASVESGKEEIDIKSSLVGDSNSEAGVSGATGLNEQMITKETGDSLDLLTKPEAGLLKNRSSRPYLSSPLPNGCHARTCRNNSYCRRLPRYNGSVYCKIHYQQYMLGVEGTTFGASECVPVTADPDHACCINSGERIVVSSGGEERKGERGVPVIPSLSPTNDAVCCGEVRAKERLAVASPSVSCSASGSQQTVSSSTSSDRRFTGLRPDEKRCEATTTRGRPCTFVAVNGTRYCHLHSSHEGNSTNGCRRHAAASAVTVGAPPPPLTVPCSLGNDGRTLGYGSVVSLPGVQDSSSESTPTIGSLVAFPPDCASGQASSMHSALAESQQGLLSPEAQFQAGRSSVKANEPILESKPFTQHQQRPESTLGDMMLLSSIPSDQWSNKLVLIAVGPLANHTATVVKWGNGWVTVKPSRAVSAKAKTRGGAACDSLSSDSVFLHNRRAMELYVLDEENRGMITCGNAHSLSVGKGTFSHWVPSVPGVGNVPMASQQVVTKVADYLREAYPNTVGSHEETVPNHAGKCEVQPISQTSTLVEKSPSPSNHLFDVLGDHLVSDSVAESKKESKRTVHPDSASSNLLSEKTQLSQPASEGTPKRSQCDDPGENAHQIREAPHSHTLDQDENQANLVSCQPVVKGSLGTFSSKQQTGSSVSDSVFLEPAKVELTGDSRESNDSDYRSLATKDSNSVLEGTSREKENTDSVVFAGEAITTGSETVKLGEVVTARTEPEQRHGEIRDKLDVQDTSLRPQGTSLAKEDSVKVMRDQPLVETLSRALNSRRGNLDLLFGTAALERSRRTKFKPERYEDTAMIARKRRSQSESEGNEVTSLKAPASPRARKRKDSCGVDLHKKTKTKSSQ